MSEQIHDQVSAFIDDELSNEECAFLVRRFERDPESRTKLVRYSLIGSTMRGELLQPEPDMLRRRIHDALHGAPASARPPAVASPPSRAVANGRWANPAVGLGLAASVAVAALFTVRAMNEAESVGETPAQVLSAIVPTNSAQSANVVAPLPPIRLTNYLLHHGEYAGLSRTSVHSTVVGSMEQSFLVDAVILNDASPSPAERDAR